MTSDVRDVRDVADAPGSSSRRTTASPAARSTRTGSSSRSTSSRRARGPSSTLDRRFEGWEGIAHGGIVCTILDEVMAWALVAEDNWGVTARMSVDFRKPVPIGTPIRAEGWITRSRRRVVETAGRIVDAETASSSRPPTAPTSPPTRRASANSASATASACSSSAATPTRPNRWTDAP